MNRILSEALLKKGTRCKNCLKREEDSCAYSEWVVIKGEGSEDYDTTVCTGYSEDMEAVNG